MIEAKNITVQIGDKKLVRDVSMNITPGKFSVILGKNGAGKSTFLKTLTGDMKKTSGEIFVEGRRLESIQYQHLAQKRAVMMQNATLAFSFTALEVVLMGRTPHTHGFETPRDQKISRECMKQVGVDHLMDRSFPTLSGGEKQRVQFARMLAQLWDRIEENSSCCLMLDEPLSSLDLSNQHTIMHLVKCLSRKNVAVLMILHDLNLAAQYADEINIMKDGRTFALGTPNDVFKPEIIEMAFDCPVHIMQHPHYQCPLVIAAKKEEKSFLSAV
ncbi:heme ABC transporter ATP-binding protein [Rhodohalobacter sulfatireducens]|uniref:Heme ABC transporter ATP-binding protein n=1 Tax=Rhodohalobacter sulfatireducens TaxID=2911366 RepID=A0ABS9KAV1_9BACT|nr:heme ABC transporter ATP-binding protein [Rhodohalobacter sulfatireducens]MCG2587989.1 heme ABC transporter ATP-binding protein [Rhodohalobacter sulfatireducens]